jgi:hypothetical protein
MRQDTLRSKSAGPATLRNPRVRAEFPFKMNGQEPRRIAIVQTDVRPAGWRLVLVTLGFFAALFGLGPDILHP